MRNSSAPVDELLDGGHAAQAIMSMSASSITGIAHPFQTLPGNPLKATVSIIAANSVRHTSRKQSPVDRLQRR
jgi:hypothetical protein